MCQESSVVFDHRNFRVTTDVAVDAQGVQWLCRAAIERIDGSVGKGAPATVEILIPRAKIDPLMAMSALEHRARTEIDEWHARGHA